MTTKELNERQEQWVYAGRRELSKGGTGVVFYEVNDDGTIGTDHVFMSGKWKNPNPVIGGVYNMTLDDEGVYLRSSKGPAFSGDTWDADDRLVAQWEANDKLERQRKLAQSMERKMSEESRVREALAPLIRVYQNTPPSRRATLEVWFLNQLRSGG